MVEMDQHYFPVLVVASLLCKKMSLWVTDTKAFSDRR